MARPKTIHTRRSLFLIIAALVSQILLAWPIGIAIAFFSAFGGLGLWFAGKRCRRNGKNSKWLFSIAPVQPILVVLGLVVFTVMQSTICTSPSERIRRQYRREHPGSAFPCESYFGFTLGHDSYNEVVSLLKRGKAYFRVSMDSGNSRKIAVDAESFTPFRNIGKGGSVFLSFDENNFLYKLSCVYEFGKFFEDDSQCTEMFCKASSQYREKFLPLMQRAKVENRPSQDVCNSYYSPRGENIFISSKNNTLYFSVELDNPTGL